MAAIAPVTDPAALSSRLLEALLASDRRAAERVIDEALQGLSDGIAVLDDLLAPVMREVGRLWEAARITVADEHRATAIAHAMLSRIYPSLVDREPRSRGPVLLAGAKGEQHLFGLRMVADVLEGGGYDVRNIGGSLAPEALASALRRHRPVLLGLADTMGGGSLLRSVAAVRAVDLHIPILLGGAGAGAAATAVGDRVVVCASVRAARAEAERLLDS